MYLSDAPIGRFRGCVAYRNNTLTKRVERNPEQTVVIFYTLLNGGRGENYFFDQRRNTSVLHLR